MDIETIEKAIGYRFKDAELAKTALVHSSYANERPEPMENNERLEFLGDAVLSLCTAHMLTVRFNDAMEGYLSKARARLVNSTSLAHMARRIGLNDCILLGKGEERTNGREKDSILAGALEALIGAVYLDGGFAAAFDIVEGWFEDEIGSALDPREVENAKNLLQELAQAIHKETPTYEIVDETGPDHDKTFRCVVRAGGIEAQGEGKSKKSAQEAAAKKALAILERSKDRWPQDPL